MSTTDADLADLIIEDTIARCPPDVSVHDHLRAELTVLQQREIGRAVCRELVSEYCFDLRVLSRKDGRFPAPINFTAGGLRAQLTKKITARLAVTQSPGPAPV